mmetsp:Transcript_128106/g.409562  ORF Transcript_128106/g.409562 Transcript_128106/m.409562 type:complete len:80 (-) Transcript_128106:83-322(-)
MARAKAEAEAEESATSSKRAIADSQIASFLMMHRSCHSSFAPLAFTIMPHGRRVRAWRNIGDVGSVGFCIKSLTCLATL